MRTIAFAAALAAVALSAASCSQPKLEKKVLEPRVIRLVQTPGGTVRGEALLQHDVVTAFYQARNSQPAWDLPDDAESIREAIVGIVKDGLDPRDYHLAAIDTLLGERGRERSDDSDADLEILLTDAVAGMIDEVRYGRVRVADLDKRWGVNPREGAP